MADEQKFCIVSGDMDICIGNGLENVYQDIVFQLMTEQKKGISLIWTLKAKVDKYSSYYIVRDHKIMFL